MRVTLRFACAYCWFAVTCSRSKPPDAAQLIAPARDVISDAVHNDGTPGFYFLTPMVPAMPTQLAPSAPPGSFGGPWVVIDGVSLSPAGCTSDCIATVITPNVTTITRTGTSNGKPAFTSARQTTIEALDARASWWAITSSRTTQPSGGRWCNGWRTVISNREKGIDPRNGIALRR